MTAFVIRAAAKADAAAIAHVMARSIAELQIGYLPPAAIAASRDVMGLDTQLITDRTYFVAVQDSEIVGCGGWSRRRTLFGGDHSTALRDAASLDPACDAARVRAMYTDPAFVRRGIGAAILRRCEDAARAAGFGSAELMATLAGEPLYRAHGYGEIERTVAEVDGIAVSLVRMGKRLS